MYQACNHGHNGLADYDTDGLGVEDVGREDGPALGWQSWCGSGNFNRLSSAVGGTTV